MASQQATVLGPTDAPSLRDSALAIACLTAHSTGLPSDLAAAAAPQLATQLLERLLKHPILDVPDLRLRRVIAPAVDEGTLDEWREQRVGAALLQLRSRGSFQDADRLVAALKAWSDVKSCAVPRRGLLPFLRPADEEFPAGTAHVLPLTQTQAVVTLLLALAGSSPRTGAAGHGVRVTGQPLGLDFDGPPLPRHDGLHLPRPAVDAGSTAWHDHTPSDRSLLVPPAQTTSPLLPPHGQVGLFGSATPAGGLVSALHGELWQARLAAALPPYGDEPRTPGGTHDVAPTHDGDGDDDDDEEGDVTSAAALGRSEMWVTAGNEVCSSGSWAVVPSWDDGLTPAQTAALPRGTWGCESPQGDASGFGAMYGQLCPSRLGPNTTSPAAWSADSIAGYALDAVRGNAGAARRLAGVGGDGQRQFQHHAQLMPRAPGTSAGAVATVLAPLLAAGGHRVVVEAFIQAHRGGVQGAKPVVPPGRQTSRSASCAAAVALATALAAHMARVDACLAALPVAVAVRRGGSATSQPADIAARPPSLLELAAHTAGLRRQLAHLTALCNDVDKGMGSDAAVLTALHAAASDVAHESMAPLLRRLFAAALKPRSSSLFDQAFGVSDAVDGQPLQEVPLFLADAARDAAQAAAALRLMARLPGCAVFLEACRQVKVSMEAATQPLDLPATLLTAHSWHEAHAHALSSRAAALAELQAAAQRGMSGLPDEAVERSVAVSILWDDGAQVAQPQGPSQQEIAALFGSVVAVRRTRFGGDTLDDGSELQAIRARAAAGLLSRGAGLADLVSQPSRLVSRGADGEPNFGRGQGLRTLTTEPEPADSAVDAVVFDAPPPTLEEPSTAASADELSETEPLVGQQGGGVPMPAVVMPPAAFAVAAPPNPMAPFPTLGSSAPDAPCPLSLALRSAVTHPLARQRAAACAASVAAAWAPPCRLAAHVAAIHDFLLLGRGDFADALLDALPRRLKRTTRDRGAALRVADAAAALAEALGSLGVPGEFVSAHLGVEAPLPGAGGTSSQASLTGLDAFRLRYDPVAISFSTSSWVASVGAGGSGAAAHVLAPPEGDILRAVLPPATLRTYSDAQVALLRLRHACRAAMEARGAAMEAARGAGGGSGGAAGPSAMSASDARLLCACAHVAVRVTQALCDHAGAEMRAALRALEPDAPAMAQAPSLQHLAAAHVSASGRAARVSDLGHVAPGVRAASLAALATVFDFRAVLLMPANASTAAALAAGAAVRTAAGELASACRAAEGVAVTEGRAKGGCHEADILARLDLGEQLLAEASSVK
jgi:hypothetical protein